MNIDKHSAALLSVLNEICESGEDLAVFVVIDMQASVEKNAVVARIISNVKTDEIPRVLGQVAISIADGSMVITEQQGVKFTKGTDVVQ